MFGKKGQSTTMLCVAFDKEQDKAHSGGANGLVYHWTGNQLTGTVSAHQGPVFAMLAVEKVCLSVCVSVYLFVFCCCCCCYCCCCCCCACVRACVSVSVCTLLLFAIMFLFRVKCDSVQSFMLNHVRSCKHRDPIFNPQTPSRK